MFTRYVVLVNPASTHAIRAQRKIAELARSVGKKRIHTISTVPGGRSANKDLLAQHHTKFKPDTLLCIAAGDGTIGLAIEELTTNPLLPAKLRNATVLPLWGGNANDLAHMLNGPSRQPVASVLEQGQVVTVRPLFCDVAYASGKQERRIATCYMSFGATAYAAARLNKPQHRGNPLHRLPHGRAISEIAASINGLLEASRFAIREQNTRQLIYERVFTNGSRFAKIEHSALQLTDGAFYSYTLPRKHVLHVAARVFAMLGKQRSDGTFLQNPVSFSCEEPIMAQFDGEPLKIPAHTTFTIGLLDQSFQALSTRLAPKEAL